MAGSTWQQIEKLVEEIVVGQQKGLLKCGSRIVPTLTSEDVLQPNDYPDLEANPDFRYEEGILHGMQSIQIALRAIRKEQEEGVQREKRKIENHYFGE